MKIPAFSRFQEVMSRPNVAGCVAAQSRQMTLCAQHQIGPRPLTIDEYAERLRLEYRPLVSAIFDYQTRMGLPADRPAGFVLKQRMLFSEFEINLISAS